MPAGDGSKTVNVQYKDIAGNVASKTDSIVLDMTAPQGTMFINGGAATTTVPAVTLNSAMTDSGSGIYQMRIDPGTGVVRTVDSLLGDVCGSTCRRATA